MKKQHLEDVLQYFFLHGWRIKMKILEYYPFQSKFAHIFINLFLLLVYIHRMLLAILNTKISRVRKTLVFGTVLLVESTPNSPFYPILQAPIMIFPEKLNFTYYVTLNYQFYSIMIKGAVELDNTEIMGWFLNTS